MIEQLAAKIRRETKGFSRRLCCKPGFAPKSDELARLAQKGMLPTYGVGNTASDATAYDNALVAPLDHRIFYQFTDSDHGGRRIEAYSELLGEFGALPLVCP